WDMYGVKASESLTSSAGQLGSRLANRANMGFAAGRESKQGPTPEMLRAYYRVVAVLSGDITSGVLGPFGNRSQNDIALFNDFLTAAGGLAQPRGMFVQGDGFGQSEKQAFGIDPAHGTFLGDKLGVVFRNASYQSLSGNTNPCADLLTTTSLTAAGDVFGVMNTCTWSNDVYHRNPAIGESVEGAFYENLGVNGPYVADVVKPATALRPWIAVTSGYEIEHLLSRYCETASGRAAYYYYMWFKAFSSICAVVGSPPQLDVPGHEHLARDFLRVGSSVMRQSTSSVRFGVSKAGRVQITIYDVTGRRIRQLADRVFAAGEHTLVWDGSSDTGAKVARGVYFMRSSTQPESKRIIVLNP
ncbi:MAG: FlgD immunoglobulin-like domain containing protein, partial [Candidatus Eisenbacteria bacterium]